MFHHADLSTASKETLRDLSEAPEERGERQTAMRSLMPSDNILYSFTQMAQPIADVPPHVPAFLATFPSSIAPGYSNVAELGTDRSALNCVWNDIVKRS